MHRPIVEFLLDCGANVNCVFNGQSPLFKAAVSRNLDLVEFLVANGADVNQKLPYLKEGTVLREAGSVRNPIVFYRENNFA